MNDVAALLSEEYREQYASVNKHNSNRAKVDCGVPHGPLLFSSCFKFSLNIKKKSNFISCNKNEIRYKRKMQNIHTQHTNKSQVPRVKFLGVIDENLTWKEHIELCKKTEVNWHF